MKNLIHLILLSTIIYAIAFSMDWTPEEPVEVEQNYSHEEVQELCDLVTEWKELSTQAVEQSKRFYRESVRWHKAYEVCLINQ